MTASVFAVLLDTKEDVMPTPIPGSMALVSAHDRRCVALQGSYPAAVYRSRSRGWIRHSGLRNPALRHEIPKVDLYGLDNLDHGDDLKDEPRAYVNEGCSTS